MPDTPPKAYTPYTGSWTQLAPHTGRFWLASAVGAGVGAGLFATLVLGMESYATELFIGTPFLMGLVSALVLNQRVRYDFSYTAWTIPASQLIIGVGLLLFAMEGLICLLMALPLGLVTGLVGAGVGYLLSAGVRSPGGLSGVFLLLAPLLIGSAADEPTWPLRAVVTEIEIDAPPEAVWPFVLGFGELPPPAEWIFRLGIAHPLRARLDGEGVGAIRYCEFSTGPFVEPITGWEPPHRLAFDVSAQPEPMHEWSPYQNVYAPHLLHGLESQRGEFRLIELPNGRTLLRGTTWYEVRMGPQLYWSQWSDAIIHGIHKRVLRQIKVETEAVASRTTRWRPRH